MSLTLVPFHLRRSRTVEILVASLVLAACSSSQPGPGVTATDAGQVASYSGSFNVTLWGFLDLPTENSSAQKPKYVYVAGQVYDGPYPQTLVDTPLPLPDDATPGCAVYRSLPPHCHDIGGCGADSTNLACAASADTKPCVCAAENTCQPYPKAVDVGQVTMAGIADSTGATSFTLANVSNNYQVPNNVTLTYPGFSEGAELTLSATGGDAAPFRTSAKGVAPLLMNAPTNGYILTRNASSADPTAYEPLTLQWEPPADASNTTFEVEIDLSRHGGTVGYLACAVPDTGSLTISSGLVSQLVQLGSVAGFAELAVARVTSASTQLPDDGGEIEFEVASEDEYVISVQGYTSCLQDSDCSGGQKCDRSVKLCGTSP